jgi:release factor glutamine methyltransferase
MIYRGLALDIFHGVYRPCDDSFLLAENLRVSEGEKVLDMGTGCGIQGILAAKQGALVKACDISTQAVDCAKHNAAKNGVEMDVIGSDLFQRVKGTFDLIAFNPPYLPSDPAEALSPEALAWDGGRTGREVALRFISRCAEHLEPGGRVLLVASSLSGIKEVEMELSREGIRPRILGRRRFFFEELCLVEGRL